MKKRKTIMIITAFIVIILGLGSFMLVRGIGKTPVSDEQKYEPIKAPNAQTSVKIAATTGDKEKKNNKQMEESTTPSSLSVPPVPIADKSELKTVSTYTGDPSQKEKGEGGFSAEEDEKRCIAVMNEQGWYKPEDVPIIYGPVPKNDPPPGVWMWEEVVKGEYAGTEKPAYIKEKLKEIDVKLQEAHAKGDHDEIYRLGMEFSEINRPYQNSASYTMYLGAIPKSWSPYFKDIFGSESKAKD